MAFVGNLNGPRESEIVLRLGPDYFGIDRSALDRDVEDYEETERNKAVAPVRVAEDGRYYVWFSGREKQRFYLDEHGYALTGDVQIRDDDKRTVEVKRPDDTSAG